MRISSQLLTVLFPDPLVISIFVYTLTGVISPTLIDYVTHTYDVDKWALFPVLATAIGLALVSPLSRQISIHFEQLPLKTASDIKSAGMIATLDLTATSLVTIGLVNVGSATFTVIYSSAAAWTAILSWYSGKSLSKPQVIGVFLVTLGLFFNGVGHVYEDETRTESGLILFGLSCLSVLIGTIFHSLVMIRIDEFSRTSKGKALQIASSMGRIEIVVLLCWNLFRIFFLSSTSLFDISQLSVLPWFIALSFNQALHSLSFFSMIDRLGAVGSAVLKGFLALNTFGLAAILFCGNGHSEQCLTPLKTISMGLVLIGGLIYGISSKRKKTDTVLPL